MSTVSSGDVSPAFPAGISSSAKRDLKRLFKRNRKSFDAVDSAIKELEQNPRMAGVEQLTMEDAIHRLRVGDYRILFKIDNLGRSISIERVRHRRDVYRH